MCAKKHFCFRIHQVLAEQTLMELAQFEMLVRTSKTTWRDRRRLLAIAATMKLRSVPMHCILSVGFRFSRPIQQDVNADNLLQRLTRQVTNLFKLQGRVLRMILLIRNDSDVVFTLNEMEQRVYFKMLKSFIKLFKTEAGRSHLIRSLSAVEYPILLCEDANRVRDVVIQEFIHQAKHDFTLQKRGLALTVATENMASSFSLSRRFHKWGTFLPQWPMSYVQSRIDAGALWDMNVFGLIEGRPRCVFVYNLL